MNMPTIGAMLATIACLLSPGAVPSASAQPQAPQDASLPSVHDLKHPTAEDKQLIKSVRRRLARTSGLNPSNVSVLAHGGVVVLSGTVPDEKDAEAAAAAAAQVPNVTSVISKLTIRAPM